MGFFKSISTLVNPKKAEFTKRLIAKRRACAVDKISAGCVSQQTSEYKFRELGLESMEFCVTPEATIVEILEKYWLPHIMRHYTEPYPLQTFAYSTTNCKSAKEICEVQKERANAIAHHIEYLITRKLCVAKEMPEFDNFIDYMKYRVSIVHTGNSHVCPEYGYTNEFYQYALDESKYVFRTI
jgi:hypothetical protein